jgi:hypothetical protein
MHKVIRKRRPPKFNYHEILVRQIAEKTAEIVTSEIMAEMGEDCLCPDCEEIVKRETELMNLN